MPRLVFCCKFTESKHNIFPNTTPEELVQAASGAKIFFSAVLCGIAVFKNLSGRAGAHVQELQISGCLFPCSNVRALPFASLINLQGLMKLCLTGILKEVGIFLGLQGKHWL